ncbi:MAG: ABC transporter substrate-binding protein [Pseudomonadota bacterium]
MNPVAPEDSVFEVAPRSFWQALRDLAISAIVVTAIALIVSFISAASAHAQGKPKGELRIGYQKSASLFVLQKAQGTLEKKLSPLGFGVKWVEKNGLKLSDIQPVYLAPADGRAAFESKNVDAWVIWDPFQAAAEKATGARVLADGAPDVVNNYQYYLGERGFVKKHPQVIDALFADSVEQGIWLKKNLRQAAELIAPLQGLPVDVVELALRRYEFNVKPITAAVAADQQQIADTFYALKLIPKPIKVSDAVVTAQP